jgi:hypothetical protein
MRITEQDIPNEIMGPIKNCANDALKVLGADLAKADPPTVVEAIDDFAYRWQRGETPPNDVVEDSEAARLIMGSLWGEQLIKQFAWQWARVTFHDHCDSVAIGVFSPDRSLAIYPHDFMRACLNDKNVDVTVMLAFNMLQAGTIPKMESKSYTNVMDGVHRIVPRD